MIVDWSTLEIGEDVAAKRRQKDLQASYVFEVSDVDMKVQRAVIIECNLRISWGDGLNCAQESC